MPRLARAWRAPLLVSLAAACASTPPPPPEPPAWTASSREQAEALAAHLRAAGPAPPEQLVVRLAFPAGADLDLYVTDPLRETVYYANTPVRSGGALARDQRCDVPAEAVRIETVRFDAPPPGRYRVGVDYPHVCDGGDEQTPYVVSIEANGAREEIPGMARHLDFTTVVTEFDF